MKPVEVEEPAIEYIIAEEADGLTVVDPDLEPFVILSRDTIAANIEAALGEEEEKHHCQFTMDRLKRGPDQDFYDI